MKKKFLIVGLLLALSTTFGACQVTQTEEGELPEVEVDVKEGNLPKFDVDAPHVDVGTKEVTVKVPDIDVAMPGDPDYKDDQGSDGVEGDDDDDH